MRIYVTHCTDKKKESLKHTNIEVPPNELYAALWITRFMNKCRERKVQWAIFSDEYGVWFPSIRHKWYDKSPNTIVKFGRTVDLHKFRQLVSDFDQKLQHYDQIWFYRQPGGRPLHPVYQKLLEETSLKSKITKFRHIREIT